MIHVEQRAAVTLLTIDRPERRNAVDAEHLAALGEAIEGAPAAGARALVLTGAAGHFCAGADLRGLEDESFAVRLRGVLDGLRAIPIATIAAVSGAALGAGTQLSAACDLRVATADARFGIPAAKLGLMVDHWTVQRVALLAGHGPARAMLLAAEVMQGEEAHRVGFVQRLGDLDAALAWAEEVSGLAPLTIAGHKLALERLESPPADADVTDAFRRAWASEDLVEGRAAFHERRAPEFKGR